MGWRVKKNKKQQQTNQTNKTNKQKLVLKDVLFHLQGSMTSVSYSGETKLNCEIKELTDAWWEGKTRVGWQSLGSESRGSVQYSVDMQLTAQCLCGSVCACVSVCLYAKHKGNGMWVARKVMVCDLQRDLRNTLQSHPRLPSTVCLLLNGNKW